MLQMLCQQLWSQGSYGLQDLQMRESLGEETEGNLQMLLSSRKHGLDSLFKDIRVFQVIPTGLNSASVPVLQEIIQNRILYLHSWP